jgi:hypothetical protein
VKSSLRAVVYLVAFGAFVLGVIAQHAWCVSQAASEESDPLECIELEECPAFDEEPKPTSHNPKVMRT